MTEETKIKTKQSSQNNRNIFERAHHLRRLSKNRTDKLLAPPAYDNEDSQACRNLTNPESNIHHENVGSTKSCRNNRKTESMSRSFIDFFKKDIIVYSPSVWIVSPRINLHSFRNWPFEKYDLLVQAGFRYTGDNDVLHCPICNLQTHYHKWPTDEDPMIMHVQLSPLCEYAKQVDAVFKKNKATDQRKILTRRSSFTGIDLKLFQYMVMNGLTIFLCVLIFK